MVFFCDIEHADGFRKELINQNGDLVQENSKYVMKITGDDEEGRRELDNFTDPEQRYPVIATTSKPMNTGIDAQTSKLIVLDSNIRSMTEFKQIIGRGTRINEEYGKRYFTILDFRNTTDLFADPDFDGDPVQTKTAMQDEGLGSIEAEEEPDIWKSSRNSTGRSTNRRDKNRHSTGITARYGFALTNFILENKGWNLSIPLWSGS